MKKNFFILLTLLAVLSGCTTQIPNNKLKLGRHCFLNQNYGQAYKLLTTPAKHNNPEAQYALGYMHIYGLGTPHDEVTGMEWIRKSARQGYPKAVEALEAYEKKEKATKRKAAINQKRQKAKHLPAPKRLVKKTLSVTDQRLLNTSAAFYTIQLMGDNQRANVLKYRDYYRIKNETDVYKTQKNNRPWYVLIYGLYNSPKQAFAALDNLPQGLKSNKPWVKSFRQVHQEIQH